MNTWRTYLIPVLIACFATATAVASAGIVPRPEHPRPSFARTHWMNLNGDWNFAFDPEGAGEEQGWYKPDHDQWPKTIVVPYPWESKLSGIEDTEYQGAAWYQRTFTVPRHWEDRSVLLTFGAVDWYAKVWLNGQLLGDHEGGYTPFTFRLNDHLREGDNVLTVMAFDDTNPEQPVGKQVNWYTTTSGIWQTVYLEATEAPAPERIRSLRIEAGLDGEVSVAVNPSYIDDPKRYEIRILPDHPTDSAGRTAHIRNDWVQLYEYDPAAPYTATIHVPNPEPWSPDSPTLYFIQVQLLKDGELVDSVHAYFGIREVSREQHPGEDFESIRLNGEPFYILSALNQAFHPDGIYTYPSDEVIRRDVELTKEFGFNNLRLHIKVDEPRFYYWCDRLGVSVLYDMPNFWRFSEDAKRNYQLTMLEALERDFNHPSILAWVLFNETWGYRAHLHEQETQDWIIEMFNMAKSLDPTRLVEDNSPCYYDHLVTDINSWHFYIYDHQRAREHIENAVANVYPGSTWNYYEGYAQGTEPFINSEYGGVNAGMGDRDVSWCFHYLTQEMRRFAIIGGYVYTELQDIEWEHNGFMKYDRTIKRFGYEEFVPTPDGHEEFTYRDINTQDFLVLDAIAGEDISGMRSKTVPASLALFSGVEDGRYPLRWQLHAMTRLHSDWAIDQSGAGWINGRKYNVSDPSPITFHVEPERLYLLYAWVEDDEGELIARNFWTFHSFQAEPPREERLAQMMAGGPNPFVSAPVWFVRWNPTEASSVEGEIEARPEVRDHISIPGKASVEYSLGLPGNLDLSKVKRAALQLEMSACAGFERAAWPERNNAGDNFAPQTDEKYIYSSTVEALVNGVKVATLDLPNDPADYRGILSNIFQKAPPSLYGYRQEIEVPVELLKAGEPITVTLRTAEGSDTGLRLFGARSGRYPTAPTLALFEF